MIKNIIISGLHMINSPSRTSKGKTYADYISGAIKIKDGLYMGDQIAAKDMDFIISNKVTHIINTVVKKVPNLYEKYGVQYLSVNWTEKQQNIFDKRNNAINMINTFIQQAMEEGESVLIHSIHGKSRAGCVVAAYLMNKYSWSLKKTIEFITFRKDTFKIRQSFIFQLEQLQKRIMQTKQLSQKWNDAKSEEDLILLNTHKNIKILAVTSQQPKKKGKKRVTWGQKTVISMQIKPAVNILTSVSKFRNVMGQQGELILKSILKDDNNVNIQQQNQNKKQLENIDVALNTKNQSPAISKNYESIKQYQKFSQSQNFQKGRDQLRHATINNFIAFEDIKPTNTRYSSIPIKNHSQNKDKKPSTRYNNNLQTKSSSRLAPYQNIISTIKSPYDSNFMNKIGSESTKGNRKLINRDRNYINAKTVNNVYSNKYNSMSNQRGYSVNLQQHSTKRKNESDTRSIIGMSKYNNYNDEGARNKFRWLDERQNTTLIYK